MQIQAGIPPELAPATRFFYKNYNRSFIKENYVCIYS
jgi:hypothetical protein